MIYFYTAHLRYDKSGHISLAGLGVSYTTIGPDFFEIVGDKSSCPPSQAYLKEIVHLQHGVLNIAIV